MRGTRHIGLALVALSALTPSAVAAPVAGPLWVVVHPDNPTQPLDQDDVFALFTCARRFWSDQKAVVPFNAPARTPLREAFDRWALKMSPGESGRFWIDRRVRGAGTAPRKAPLPRIAIGALLRIPGAIAYVPAGTCLRGARVVAVVGAKGVRPPPDRPAEAPSCD